jgi:hypothetical protein
MAGDDIAMNAFQIVTDADYVYSEKSNNQNKIAVEDLAKQMGVYKNKWDSNKGDLLEIKAPYSIFMIGDSSTGGHIMGIFANGVIALSSNRDYSTEKDKEDSVNVYKKDEYNIIIQNNSYDGRTIRMVFLSSFIL